MTQFSVICFLLITACLVVLSSAQSGVCYSQRSRQATRTRTRYEQRVVQYRCGSWWSRRRCTRTHYYGVTYQETYTQYYSQWGCCSGYSDYNGACRRAVIALERSSYTVAENAGSVTVCAALTQSAAVPSTGISVELATVGGSARSTSDYTSTSAVVSFRAGSTRQCIRIPINYDYTSESTESFTVTLRRRSTPSYVSFSRSTTTLYIRNVYRIKVGFSPSTYRVNEDGGSVSVCARVLTSSGTIQPTLTTLRTVASAGATSPSDFTHTSRSITFTSGSGPQCTSIPIIHDSVHEHTESFSVQLTAAASHVTLSPAQAFVYISNINRAVIGLERSSYTVAENAGSVTVCAELSQNVSVPSAGISVEFRTADRSARSTSDYTSTSTVVRFRTGSTRQCIRVPINYDYVSESTESFDVTLRARSTPHPLFSRSTTTVSISNMYRIRIGFSPSVYHVNEDGGSVSVCARVLTSSGTIRTTQTDLRTISSGATSPSDFTHTSRSITFTSGSGPQCTSIPIIRDSIQENAESFSVQLTAAASHVTLDPGRATVYISDTGRVVIGLERSSYTVAENAGSVTVCAALTQSVSLGSTAISVELRTVDGSARSTSDYTSTSAVVTFRTGSTRQCIRIPINYDYVSESTESFSVTLRRRSTPSYVSFSRSTTTVSISNVYRIKIGFSPSVYRVNENGGSVSVCARVLTSSGTIQPTLTTLRTVASAGATSPSDFTHTSRSITFTSGSGPQCTSIPIIRDSIQENTESFSVQLTAASSNVTLDPATATVYISDIDRVVIGFEATNLRVYEDANNIEVCVRILQPSSPTARLEGSFDIGMSTRETRNGARASEDFFHISTTVTLTSTSRRRCQSVPIVHDALYERTESFNVILSRPSSLPAYVTLAPDSATIGIMHVHSMTIGFEQTNIPVSESAGHAIVCVKVLRPSGPSDRIEDTHYSVGIRTVITPGTDSAGARDFTILSTTRTLSSSLRRECIYISITRDYIVEPQERFTVVLTGISLPSYVMLSPAVATIIIHDA